MPQQIRRLTINDMTAWFGSGPTPGCRYKPKGRESRRALAAEIEYAGAVFFGLFENDRMVGVAIANWDGRRGWINRLAIGPGLPGPWPGGRN